MSEAIEAGRVAYEGYRTASGGKSLVSGQPIPEWDGLTEPVRQAWRAAADAVVMFRSLRGTGGDLIYPPQLTDGLRDVLGRPAFRCASAAAALRKGGWKIAQKAEHEQAAVIHFSLMHYLRTPTDWMENANAELDAMVAQATEGGVQ